MTTSFGRLSRRLIGTGLIAAFVAGCSGGGGSSSGEAAPDPNQLAASQAKDRLDYVAKTGVRGSALSGLRQALEQAGKKELLPELSRLESTKSSEEAKRIAKSMSAKL